MAMKVREVIKLIEKDGWYLLIVIEKANGNYSAYSPDLPGCVATGVTHDEVTRNMYEAIEMHVRGLIEDELPVPESHSLAEYVALPSVAL
jgi:predicted RNase H-like HicB family nuclease